MTNKVQKNNSANIKKLLYNFAALSDLGEEITSVKDFRGIQKSSLYLLMGALPIIKGSILEYNYYQRSLNVTASKGIEGLDGYRFLLERKTINLIKNDDNVIVFDSNRDIFLKEEWAILEAKLIVPMVVRNELVGIIAVGDKLLDEEYSEEDIMLLTVIAKQIGVSMHNFHLMTGLSERLEENKKLLEELQSIYYDTIQALAAAIDAKDPYTRGHSYRVSNYCEAIGIELNFSKRELEGIKIAGFLHDIGKIAIDNNIINKPSALTKDEYREIFRHPSLSYEILSRVRFPWKNIPASVLYHHERVDGKGYPERLSGVEIPTMAKVMGLADAFDAMTTDRPYKKKRSLEDAILEIKRQVGKQFDPQVAKALFEFIKNDIKGTKKGPGLLNWVNFNFNPNTTTHILNKVIGELAQLEEMYPA